VPLSAERQRIIGAIVGTVRSSFVGLEAVYWKHLPDAAKDQADRYAAIISDALDVIAK